MSSKVVNNEEFSKLLKLLPNLSLDQKNILLLEVLRPWIDDRIEDSQAELEEEAEVHIHIHLHEN